MNGGFVDLVRQAFATLDANARKSVVLAFHADADGLSAGVLVREWLARTGTPSVRPLSVATHEFGFESLLDQARTATALITLDLNLYTTAGVVEELAAADLAVIAVDDHELKTGAFPDRPGFHYLNPRLGGSAAAPSSLIGGLLLRAAPGDLDPVRIGTVAKVGLLGDWALEEHGAAFPEADVAVPELRRCVRLISAEYASLTGRTPGEDPLLDVVTSWLTAAGPAEPLSRFLVEALPRLPDRERLIEDEVGRWRRTPAQLRERAGHRRLELVHITSPMRIVNLVASQRRRTPEPMVVVVTQTVDERQIMAELRISRSAGDYDLTRLLARTADRVELISFGGHPPAAGCSFAPENHETFVRALAEAFQDGE